jgi:hypothetical protein
MKTLYEIAGNPSGMDSYSNYMGAIPEEKWLVVLTRNRDFDCLIESNWEVALEQLGGESDTVSIDRFGHWACGWWESLSVLQGSEAEKIGQEIEDSLESYPVLDEGHFSEKEYKEANRVWESCYDWAERIEYVRNNRDQFEFRSLGDCLNCIRGKYFLGYISELIY